MSEPTEPQQVPSTSSMPAEFIKGFHVRKRETP
jgi:hypothetical protein